MLLTVLFLPVFFSSEPHQMPQASSSDSTSSPTFPWQPLTSTLRGEKQSLRLIQLHEGTTECMVWGVHETSKTIQECFQEWFRDLAPFQVVQKLEFYAHLGKVWCLCVQVNNIKFCISTLNVSLLFLVLFRKIKWQLHILFPVQWGFR